MRTIKGLDQMFLGVESDRFQMDNVGFFVLDPSAAPDRHDFDRVRAELARKAPTLPVMTKRPVFVPFGLGAPKWAVDPSFDIDNHVIRVTAPAPGGFRELAAVALDVTARPMARDRPLWRVFYVEGLADGRAAILLQLHHAIIDGMGGVELLDELFDPEPLPFDADAVPEEVVGEPVPSKIELLARSIPEGFSRSLSFAAAVRDLAAAQLRARNRPARSSGASISSSRSSSPTFLFGPRTPLNGTTKTSDRGVALLTVPLAELREIKDAFGATVNEVVLAAVAGSLRNYLIIRGALPAARLKTLYPVNVRIESDDVAEGNQFSLRLLDLPTDLDDPVERIRALTGKTSIRRRARTDPQSDAAPSTGRALLAVLDQLPPQLWSGLGWLAPSPVMDLLPPVVNVCVSNVRSFSEPVYFAGAQVTHMFGRAFNGAGVGLFIHCASYVDDLHFGFTTLRELIPDPEVIADGVRADLDHLLKRVRG